MSTGRTSVRQILNNLWLLPALLLCACASGPRPVLETPQESVQAMRKAFFQDEPGLFIHCLSGPVLDEYNEQTIRIGWSKIKPLVGELVERSQVIKVEDFQAALREPMPSAGFVRPSRDTRLIRVVLQVDGKRESLLFQREVDPPPPTSRQAQGFWIGDRYFVRGEHPAPDTYLVEDSPEQQRTHWRLVFPYEPFQLDGEISGMLQRQLSDQTTENR